MQLVFLNLDWKNRVSRKTFKLHFALPPLDLLLMQNFAAEAGHQALLVDEFADGSPVSKEVLQGADWIVVTTTPYHMWQCPNAEWDLIKERLSVLPHERTVLTGLHATVFPEKTLRETGMHCVIRREPEAVLRRFLLRGAWHGVEGTSRLDGDRYVEEPLGQLPPMDELVVKDYNLDISRYSYFLLGGRAGIFESSRGCPWKCTFCDQEMFSWQYRLKSPAVFTDEVARGVRRAGMRCAYFYDLEFTVSKPRTLEICSLLESQRLRGFRWACQTRADMVDEESLRAMRSAGCALVHFGVESANPEVLKATNKKITLEKIERGVRLAKEAGLQTACFFMFGLPEERPEEFKNTVEFARRLNPTYASFHFAVPFPGTPLYTRYLKEKSLPWGEWPALYFDGWPRAEIDSFLRKAYARFYLTPRRLEPRQFLFRLQNLPEKLACFRAMTLRP